MSKFRSAALTEIGRFRIENEDRFIQEITTQLLGVADGVCVKRHGNLEKLTEDHTVENEIHPLQALGAPVHYYPGNPGASTRCIALFDQLERYFFCTDGVAGMINDRELDHLMALPIESETLVREIIQLAVNRGDSDTTTAVIVYTDAP